MNVSGTGLTGTGLPGRNDSESRTNGGISLSKFGVAGRSICTARPANASNIPSLHTYWPGSIPTVAVPNGICQDSSCLPAAIGSMAKRCPSRTVASKANVPCSVAISVPLSNRRVAMATLSPGNGRRATEENGSDAMGKVLTGRRKIRQACSWTSILPLLAPVNRLMKACGACSIPCAMVSCHLTWPASIHFLRSA